MFKKLMLSWGCTMLFITLVACAERESESIVESNLDPEPMIEEAVEFEFSIEMISDDELASLEDYTAIHYAKAHHLSFTEGLNLHFNFNQPITDFSLISVTFLDTETATFAKTGILYEVENLNPEIPLVITNYIGHHGTMPVSGFYFATQSGESRWFTLQQSQMDGSIVWSPFDWSHDHELYVVGENRTNEENVESDIHIVQVGQTLFSISQMHDTTVEALQQLNGLGTSTDIQVGQQLNIRQRESDLQNINPEIIFTFEWLDDTNIETLPNLIEFDYSAARNASYFQGGLNVLVRTHNHLTDFQVVALDMDINGRLTVMGALYDVGNFTPSESLLIRSYFEHGSFPRSGFSFVDEQNIRRNFVFYPDQVDSDEIFGWEIND